VLASLRDLPAVDVLVLAAADAQAARELARQLPAGVPVLWLGEAPDLPRSAATGHLAEGATDEALAAAVNALAHGLHVQDAAQRALPPAAAELSEPLTPRELEVLELMAKGLANREIALALGISSHTAKFHVAQILEKAGAATRTEAVRQALRLGLIGL
jgi:DNA-binding NarL/FixJ family response regulator